MLFYRRLVPPLLDSYIVREIIPPTSLGLLVFTFILLLDSIPKLLSILVSRGADLYTILRVFFNLLPSIFAVTIPMAFLLGVLLAFGRLASESEIVAMRASGISPLRLLRPVLALCLLTGGITFYVNAVALPAANQAHRELVFSLVVSKARSAVRPRVFTDDLVPQMVVYVSDIPAETVDIWNNVFIQDVRNPQKPAIILARTGHLNIDKDHKTVKLALGRGVRHNFDPAQPKSYTQERFSEAEFPLPFDEFFPKVPLSKGDREMTLPELSSKVKELRAQGKPKKEYARFAVEWHKKFAIATACLVFGVLGLALSLGSRKEARSAAFGLSIAVIFVYYVLIRLGEQAGDTGLMPPFLAMWGANIVLGTVAVGLLVLNHREAAFDPLDPAHYLAWLPQIRRGPGASAPVPGRVRVTRPGRRTTVVVRIPRFHVPLPSLLDRYIARAYLGHIGLVLAAFCAIYFLAEFMDLFDDIQQNHVKGVVVVHYYAYHIWWIAHMMAPMAVLVSVLITYGVLSRRNEITAMKAGGISLYRAAAPVLAMAALASSALYGLQEFVLPTTNRIAAMDFNVIKGRPPQSSGFLDRRWILGSDNRFYNYDYLAESKRVLTGVAEGGSRVDFSLYGLSTYDVDPSSWELVDRLYAARAVWNGSSYDLERGWRLTLVRAPARAPAPPAKDAAPPGTPADGAPRPDGPAASAIPHFQTFTSAQTREIEKPSYFNREERPSDTLGFGELRGTIASLEALGFDVIPLRVQLHRKLAFPMVAVVMTLIGIPFAFVVARRGALYGIAISIVIAIVYWATLETFQALGNNALLNPLLAAWAPNLLFGAAGLYLMLTLET
jgi:LPS export ABC transporter permease LptF